MIEIEYMVEITLMLKLNLCDYSDPYILVKWTITVATIAPNDDVNNTSVKLIFKNCKPFEKCETKIKNTQIDNAKDIDVAMPM